MLCLRVKAPFAAFRTFTAGSYRPTAPFITPSAAYGLVLNVAGIESRYDDGQAPMTLMKPDLPKVEIALGAVTDFPQVQCIYQQLHNYPVGTTGEDHAEDCKGAKYNIQPVWREFLTDLDAYVCLRGNDDLEEQVSEGLKKGARWAPEGRPRYGIPFLGDNSFMVDVLREEPSPVSAYWYVRLDRADEYPVEGHCRLTVWIDRADMTRTLVYLYAPTKGRVETIPVKAWTWIEPPLEDQNIKKRRRKKSK